MSGFVAKPEKTAVIFILLQLLKFRLFEDGTTNLLTWICKIPGKKGTDWDGNNENSTLEEVSFETNFEVAYTA